MRAFSHCVPKVSRSKTLKTQYTHTHDVPVRDASGFPNAIKLIMLYDNMTLAKLNDAMHCTIYYTDDCIKREEFHLSY